MRSRPGLALLLLAATVAGLPARRQGPQVGESEPSLPGVLEAIQRAGVTTRILYVTAHPDDEPSSVLTYLAHGLGADVALLSITRGEGGQNALGLEQGPQLALLRTEELLAATRVYGARLYFTRAPDFGYSKTPQETLKVWGDAALDDMVRVIRTFRPHVVINHWAGVEAGHGHHQAAGILVPQAFAAAADPNAFPWHFAEGLRPWRTALLLQLARGDAPGGWRVPVDQVSPAWGKSYREIGFEGFKNHRTQGVLAFLNSPFLRRPVVLVRRDGAALGPELLAAPLTAIPFSGNPGTRIEQAERSLAAAREAALKLDWTGAAKALADAGKLIAAHREGIGKAPMIQSTAATETRRQALWELDRVRERIDAALASAAALQVEAQAERSELVAGESFTVRVQARRRSEVPGEFGKPNLVLPPGWKVSKEEGEPTGALRFTVAVPGDAKASPAYQDWMLPWPAPLVEGRVGGVVDGYAFEVRAPVKAQKLASTRVDTLPVTLVPAVTLALEPRQFVVAEKQPPKQMELLARVHSYSAAATKVAVGVDAPKGWRVAAPEPLEFSGPGDQLVRFLVTPPERIAAGNYALQAWAARGGEKFRTTVEPLASLPTREWSEPAVAMVRVFDVAVPEGLRVGYVAAENDPIPAALSKLGVQVELLDPVALAFRDLRGFNAIAIGIRAYELREDLSRANSRLLDYAAAGGTLVVQYQRENVWSALKPAPYPASMSQPAARITDENSPVRLLAPDHLALNFPNKIAEGDFRGWVQERGLYFWSKFDPRYQALLGLRDPGEEELTGGLVAAPLGKGTYIYTGVAFFRQLPEGVPGAYRLFINLLSQSRAQQR